MQRWNPILITQHSKHISRNRYFTAVKWSLISETTPPWLRKKSTKLYLQNSLVKMHIIISRWQEHNKYTYETLVYAIFALEHLIRNNFLQVLQSAFHHCLGFSITIGPSPDKKQDKQLVMAFSSSRSDCGSSSASFLEFLISCHQLFRKWKVMT